VIAEALVRLDVQHALVVHAEVGMDEIAPTGTTAIWEVRDGVVRAWKFDPAEVDLDTGTVIGLEGGSPEENARTMRTLFSDPAAAPAALRAAVALNAAAAIYVAGGAATIGEGTVIALAALESGAALRQLDALIAAAPR
ncbi:MAG: anthranilate phosphoribosyltransferase, partial [Gemmatimonadales bacterium]